MLTERNIKLLRLATWLLPPLCAVAAIALSRSQQSGVVVAVSVISLGALVTLVLAATIAARVAGRQHIRDEEAREWAAAHALRLTRGNRGFVGHYLRTGRQLRTVCVLGGIFLPGLVVSAFDPDRQPAFALSLVGVLAGYLLGTVWAELALTRPPAGTARVASLHPRRLEDYLPRTLRLALRIVGPTTALLWALALLLRTEPEPGRLDGGVEAGTAILWGIASLLMPVLVEATQRWILRRPQPLVAADLVAADDAIRSQSLHLLGGTGVGIGLCWAIGPLIALATEIDGPLAWPFGLSAVACLFGAVIFWRYWGNRAWRVRRHDLRPAPAAPTPVGS